MQKVWSFNWLGNWAETFKNTEKLDPYQKVDLHCKILRWCKPDIRMNLFNRKWKTLSNAPVWKITRCQNARNRVKVYYKNRIESNNVFVFKMINIRYYVFMPRCFVSSSNRIFLSSQNSFGTKPRMYIFTARDRVLRMVSKNLNIYPIYEEH